MTNFFLQTLEKLDRKRVIMDRESKEPYLIRYYLFLKDRDTFPFNIFLHKFLRSDPDMPHNHPWPYFTIILKGGYWEWIPIFGFDENSMDDMLAGPDKDEMNIIGEKRVWRGPGHFRVCPANSYHRIEVEPGVDCWTLFMPGKKTQDWGFLTHKNWDWKTVKWVQHEKYIEGKVRP